MGSDSIDRPKPGANADVTVFGLRDGSFEVKDSDGDVVTAKRRLLCRTTIKGRAHLVRTAGRGVGKPDLSLRQWAIEESATQADKHLLTRESAASVID